MTPFLFIKRNPRRVLPVVVSVFFAIAAVSVFAVLGKGLRCGKETFIEVYRAVQVLRAGEGPVDHVSSCLVPVSEGSLSAKLVFGTTRLPLFRVAERDLGRLLGLLSSQFAGAAPHGAGPGPIPRLLITERALASVSAARGLPATLKDLPRVLIEGPPVAVLVDQEVQADSFVDAAGGPLPPGFIFVRRYDTELQSVRGEDSFVRALLATILAIVVLATVVVAGLTTHFTVSGRSAEFAIFQIIGHPLKRLLLVSIGELAAVILGGALAGGVGGQAVGRALLNALTPGGAPLAWSRGIELHVAMIPLALTAVAAAVAYRAMRSLDPVRTIEKASEVL